MWKSVKMRVIEIVAESACFDIKTGNENGRQVCVSNLMGWGHFLQCHRTIVKHSPRDVFIQIPSFRQNVTKNSDNTKYDVDWHMFQYHSVLISLSSSWLLQLFKYHYLFDIMLQSTQNKSACVKNCSNIWRRLRGGFTVKMPIQKHISISVRVFSQSQEIFFCRSFFTIFLCYTNLANARLLNTFETHLQFARISLNSFCE